MIGKIMSEVSHSIIGMLSAKPDHMETRASNLDFTALLTSSGEQYRFTPGAGSPEALDQDNPDRFLEQLSGVESQTDLTSSTVDTTQIMPPGLLNRSLTLDSELFGDVILEALPASDDISVVPASTEPEIASDIDKTQLGHTQTIGATGGISAGTISSSSPFGSAKSDPFFTNARDALSLPKAEFVERANVEVERNSTFLNAKQNASQTESPAPTVEPNAPMHGIRGDIFPASRNMSRLNSVPTLTTNIPKSADKSKILDSIDLRLASKIDAKGSSHRSLQDVEFPDVLADGEKRVIVDPKTTLVGTNTATNLETLAREIPREIPSANLPIQSAANKIVTFDWNAPNFAGRFAAEVSGMTTDGDSKKFEINPRNLGRLEVAFVTRGAAEFIRIEAETDAARDVILQNAQAIQDMLKAQGRSDLTIRVDVKESGFSSLNGGDLNQAQQDSAGTNESGENVFSKNSQNEVREAGRNTEIEPEKSSDSSRYA